MILSEKPATFGIMRQARSAASRWPATGHRGAGTWDRDAECDQQTAGEDQITVA
jgi:hypothetical protein